MINYLHNKLAISKQGAKDLLKGSFLSALVNISMMVPVGISIMLLNQLIQPIFSSSMHPQISIAKYLILILVSIAIMYICHYYQYSSVYLLTYKESATKRIVLAEKLRELPLDFFGKRDLSDLTSTIMSDCTTLEHAFSHAIPQLFGAILSTTIIIIGLLFINLTMGIATLWVLPVALIMLLSSRKLQNKLKSKHYHSKLSCADSIQECLENIQDIKAYNMKENYLKKLDEKLNQSEHSQIQSELAMGACVTGAQAVLRLGLATTILVGITLLTKGTIDLLTYLVFLITASRLYDPLSLTLTNIAEIFELLVPIKHMQEIENHPIQKGEKHCEINQYDIKFDHVLFSYLPSKSVLKNVSFVAKQGEITALIGASGGGKSTVAKLAARFWDIDCGKITLGGKNIETIDPETLLKNYSIVFQDVTLFNDTILENIRLGKRTATDEEVKAAATNAMCHEFIMKLPQGYDTIIGENGSTLSGGERQRISIARAFLKDAPIVLLDEATASLDVENETQIQEALSELVRNKTVLVIAHRMRTIANADKIIVLQNGYVSEQGKPEELLAKGGFYKQMVELQNHSMNWSL